jgi:predicted transcriptional regulator
MVQIGFKIKKETKQKLARLANKQDRSISSVARIAIEKGLLFFDKGGPHQSKKI